MSAETKRESTIYEYIGNGSSSVYSEDCTSFEYTDTRGQHLFRKNAGRQGPHATDHVRSGADKDPRVYSVSWDECTLLARLSNTELGQLCQQLSTSALPVDALFWFRASQTGEEIAITGNDLLSLATSKYMSDRRTLHQSTESDDEFVTVRLSPAGGSNVPDRPPIPSFASGSTYYEVMRDSTQAPDDPSQAAYDSIATEAPPAPPAASRASIDLFQQSKTPSASFSGPESLHARTVSLPPDVGGVLSKRRKRVIIVGAVVLAVALLAVAAILMAVLLWGAGTGNPPSATTLSANHTTVTSAESSTQAAANSTGTEFY